MGSFSPSVQSMERSDANSSKELIEWLGEVMIVAGAVGWDGAESEDTEDGRSLTCVGVGSFTSEPPAFSGGWESREEDCCRRSVRKLSSLLITVASRMGDYGGE